MNRTDIKYLTDKLIFCENWPQRNDPFYNIQPSFSGASASFRYSGMDESDLCEILAHLRAFNCGELYISDVAVLHTSPDEDFSNREQLHTVFVCLYKGDLFLITFRFCAASVDSDYDAFIAGRISNAPDAEEIRRAWESAITRNDV